MKQLHYIDNTGKAHVSIVRQQDDDPRIGIPLEPPDVGRIDWECVKTDLHNELTVRGIRTLNDVRSNGNGFTGAILSALKNRLIALYREEEEDKKQ